MYTQYFKLSQAPFSIAPDPRYLFMSERHREALAHLLYGIDSGGGFVLLTGEIGTGKTTICRCFMGQIPPNCKVAYIFNPKLTVGDLLKSVCDEFGIVLPDAAPQAPSIKTYVDTLNAYLLAQHAQGRNNVLIIDEAQNLSADVLEQLRLLTNLETNERKLLQIILIGQPELRAMLAAPRLEQLAQRVIARYHLGPLSADETARYIRHRLAITGMTDAQPFRKDTLPLIHAIAKGIPRRINLLCDRALLGAYAEGKHVVDRGIVSKAACEVFGEKRPGAGRRQLWQGALAGILLTILLAGAAAWALRGGLDVSRLAARWRGQDAQAAVAGASIGALPDIPRSAPAASAETSPAAETPAPQAAATADKPQPAAASFEQQAAPAPAAEFATQIRPPSDARQANQAYRDLARLFGVTLADGDPCAAAQAGGLRCYQSDGGLAEIRQLDRPAVLLLQDGANRQYPALLTGLTTASAMLDIGGQPQTVSLVALGRHFRGGFLTFWRAPKSFRDRVRAGDQGADVDWIAAQLARQEGAPPPRAGQTYDPPLAREVREFQAAHGLEKDGLVGPKTFMHLNNAAGIDEPRLKAGLPAPGALPVK